jgi:hypothetical protein
MRISRILFVAVVLLVAHPLDAQAPATVDFKPLEFLVGRCWVGTFPDGKKTDEHCFEWVFDRKFIRDRHSVRGAAVEYQGETLFGWDEKARHLGYWYWNSEGQMMVGTVLYEPGAIVFPTRYETEKGPVEIRAVWTAMGTDSYQVSQSQRSGAEWKPLWTMTLKRIDR